MEDNKFKIEWGLSLLNKYGSIIIENELDMELTKTQVMFMIHISQRTDIHQDQLAKIFKINRSTVTRAINQLENKGYVIRIIDDKNKKTNIISLTDLGKNCLEKINRAIDFWIVLITEGFSEEEVELSKRLITKMASNACNFLGDHHLAQIILR